MVAHQQAGAFVRNVLHALFLDAVQHIGEHPHQQADQELRHPGVDVGGHQHIGQRQHQEELRYGEIEHADQHDTRHRRTHHEQGIENIVGGDDARQMAGVGTLLDQREQRHDIEAAEHPDAKQIHHHPPAGRLLQEGGDVHRHILGQAGVGEEQVDAEGAQPD